MGRRALITGATGFVGGHLTELLVGDGWEIRALVRPTSDARRLRELGAELHMGGLADRDAMRRASAGVDVVYHLAAVTGLRAEKDFARANAEGTENVVAAVRAADPRPQRLVYLSSYAACGPSEPGKPRTGRDTPGPLTAYGRTKLAGEEAVRPLADAGVESVIVRAPPVYGPGDHAFLPYFRLIRLGIAPAPAGGELQTHMIHVRDLARALLHAADAPPGTYAVAEPVEHRWGDIVSAMGDALGKRPVRISLPRPLVRSAAALTQGMGELLGKSTVFNREKADEMLAPAWVCDLSGSEALLPLDEVTPLREGISETASWYIRQGWL
jgi:dihydroflavonol-4-reductase